MKSREHDTHDSFVNFGFSRALPKLSIRRPSVLSLPSRSVQAAEPPERSCPSPRARWGFRTRERRPSPRAVELAGATRSALARRGFARRGTAWRLRARLHGRHGVRHLAPARRRAPVELATALQKESVPPLYVPPCPVTNPPSSNTRVTGTI